MDCKEIRKQKIRLIFKKASMAEEGMIGPEIVQEKDDPELNKKRKKHRPSKPAEANQETHSDNARQTKDELDAEVGEMFDRIKKRKKMNQKTPQETALLVEKAMALLEVAVEEDVELNKQEKPTTKKLQMLPLLTDFLSKKKLQGEFLDHGILTLLKNWLEPLPDGSLPNATVRSSILKILTEAFPIDVEQEDRREQLQKSGLGKVIMFLSESEEEITTNKRLAKDLTENWSRAILGKSTRFSDLRNIEQNISVPSMKPYVKQAVKQQASRALLSKADLDLDSSIARSRELTKCSSQQRASRPEATPSVCLVRPQSKFNPDIGRVRPRQEVRSRARIEMNLKRLKARIKKPLQAAKVSAQGRGIFTSL